MPTGDGSWADLIGVLLVLVLVAANGFFVAAEFSLVAVRRSRVAQLVAAGRRDGSLLIDGMMSAQDAFERLGISTSRGRIPYGRGVRALPARASARWWAEHFD